MACSALSVVWTAAAIPTAMPCRVQQLNVMPAIHSTSHVVVMPCQRCILRRCAGSTDGVFGSQLVRALSVAMSLDI